MKKLNLILTAMILFVSTSVFAQSDKFNYQAAIRDASGEIMQNESVTIAFSIKSGSASGTEVYAETHSATTNDQGLVNLAIGSGTATSGTFSAIDWSTNSHFLNLKIDGTDMGTSEFNSVPYANYAQEAMNTTNAVNSTYSDTAFYGINNFTIDSTLIMGNSNGQINSLKTSADGKLHILPNGSSIPSVTFDDDGVNGVGLGTENPTEKLEVVGNVKLTGEINKETTGTANLLPVAFGGIELIGTTVSVFPNKSTENWTVTRVSAGIYEITITGENYYVNNYTCIASIISGGAFFISTTSDAGKLEVRTFNSSGALADQRFNFVVYKR